MISPSARWLQFVAGLALTSGRLFAAQPAVVPESSFDLTASLLRLAGGLILVFALFFAGVWFVRNSSRFSMRRGPAPVLRVVESRALGARQSLHLVACGDRRFLVASSPAGVQLIASLQDSTLPEVPPTAAPSSFSEALQTAWNQRS